MVIQHNMSALNANRMLGITRRSLAGTAEKLSSGYQINRAADNAAGLSISEKMRKKIRGLEKGMENVQDGISLCQVADGALNEVADILQRVRELSIKAYNGTNSKSDRHIIQDEVDQCIAELDRVFETTKFNEIYIFRNGSRVQGEVFHPESYTKKVTKDFFMNIPDWLKVNDSVITSESRPKIELHFGYLTQQTQDINGIMKHDFKTDSGKEVKLYYGPNYGMTSDGYLWVGEFMEKKGTSEYKAEYEELMKPGQDLYESMESYLDVNGNYNGQYRGWTPELSDNVSAKLDFSGLTNVTDAKNLYNKLSELIGVELGFPCGTCSEFEAIRFGGKFEGVDAIIFQDMYYYNAKTEIDLSTKSFHWDNKEYAGYFDAITDVINMDDSDPNKTQKTTQLASAIATDLAQTTFDVLNNAMTKHYDRAIRDASDPYSVYVYDYRDTNAISLSSSVNSNVIMTYSKIRMQYDEVVEGGYYTHFDYWDSDQIWIQASDEVGDGIPILSKYLSAEFFKLKNYRVDTFASEMVWEDADAYQKRLSEWKTKAPEPTTEWYQQKVTVITGRIPGEFREYYENGELKREMIKLPVIQTKEEEREFPRLVWDESKVGPRPIRGCSVREVYAPSELSLIDDALAMVSAVRSYYGAVQNRLEHTYKNNANVHENTTAAESRIRDTDMAKEIVKNSLLNILQQAGFSMLSQANQTNQGVNMLLS